MTESFWKLDEIAECWTESYDLIGYNANGHSEISSTFMLACLSGSYMLLLALQGPCMMDHPMIFSVTTVMCLS